MGYSTAAAAVTSDGKSSVGTAAPRTPAIFKKVKTIKFKEAQAPELLTEAADTSGATVKTYSPSPSPLSKTKSLPCVSDSELDDQSSPQTGGSSRESVISSSAAGAASARTRRASAAECSSLSCNVAGNSITKQQLAKWKEHLEVALSKDPSARPTLFNSAVYCEDEESDNEHEEADTAVNKIKGSKSGANPHAASSPSKLKSITKGAGRAASSGKHILDKLRRKATKDKEEISESSPPEGSQSMYYAEDAPLDRPPKATSETVAVPRTSRWLLRMKKNRTGFMLDPDRDDSKKEEMALQFRNSIDEMVSKREQFKAKFKFMRNSNNN